MKSAFFLMLMCGVAELWADPLRVPLERGGRRGRCPHPFTNIGHLCLYTNLVRRTWDGGRKYCKDLGGALAVIKNQPEFELVKRFNKQTGRKRVWVGGTDEEREGTWKWLDGRRVNFRWARNEPNGGKKQNCLTFWDNPRHGKGLLSYYCYRNLPALCRY